MAVKIQHKRYGRLAVVSERLGAALVKQGTHIYASREPTVVHGDIDSGAAEVNATDTVASDDANADGAAEPEAKESDAGNNSANQPTQDGRKKRKYQRRDMQAGG